jgi:hypothetical protein
MRQLLFRSLAALVCLGVLSQSQTSGGTKPNQPDKPNLSGAWVLDLQASTSLDPLMTQIGAGFLDRKYAAHTKLKATLQQTADAAARSFYTSFGFEVLGPASDYAPGKTMDDSDIVLRRILAVS